MCAGDSIYTGNSTTGGEVELIYYLKEVGLGALPLSVCPYISTPIADRKCDGRQVALKSNPLKFNVRALKTYYNRQDIKAALVASNRALSLSTSMIVVPYWLPCTSQVAAQYRCDPSDATTCRACPLERAYAGVTCCVMANRYASRASLRLCNDGHRAPHAAHRTPHRRPTASRRC